MTDIREDDDLDFLDLEYENDSEYGKKLDYDTGMSIGIDEYREDKEIQSTEGLDEWGRPIVEEEVPVEPKKKRVIDVVSSTKIIPRSLESEDLRISDVPTESEVYQAEDSVFNPSVVPKDGEIKNYMLSKHIKYPCIFFDGGETLAAYVLKVFSNSIDKNKFVESEGVTRFNVYLRMGTQTLGFGTIPAYKLRTFLSSTFYSSMDKALFLSPQEQVVGEMMYAFCEVAE